MRIFLCIASLLTLLAAAAFGDQPAVVQKYADSLKSLPCLAVSIARTEPDDSPDTAYLSITQPNKFKLVSRVNGDLAGTVVCDGVSLREWDDQQSYTLAAPPLVKDIRPVVHVGKAAQAAHLLLDPFAVLGLGSLTVQGQSKMDSITIDKLTNFDSSVTLWLADSTGLPIKMATTQDGETEAYTYSYSSVGKALPDSEYAAKPPSDVPAYVPPSAAGLLPIGTPAPDFTLSGPSGQSVTLSSLKGHVVLLDFWASWCPPCRMSMPHVQKIFSDLSPRGLTVLSINTDDDQDSMNGFLAQHPELTTTFLYDPKDAATQKDVGSAEYLLTSIPDMYLVDQAGKIAASFNGYSDDEEQDVRQALAVLGIQ